MRQALVRRRPLAIVALVAAVLFLSGCGYMRDDDKPLNTLNPQGPQAQMIDDLGNQVVHRRRRSCSFSSRAPSSDLLFRYRRRKDEADGDLDPVQTHGNTRLECAWTIAPGRGARRSGGRQRPDHLRPRGQSTTMPSRSRSSASSGGGSSATTSTTTARPTSSRPTRWSCRPAARSSWRSPPTT